MLRFATADLMRPSCINCHNTHPETPKNDWKVGDVRGVLEVVQPIDAVISVANEGRRGSFLYAIGLAVFATFSFTVLFDSIFSK